MDEFHASYEYDLDPNDPNSTAAAVYRFARAGGKRVLDLGSGPAIVSSMLKRVDGRNVVCMDNDRDRLAVAAGRGVDRTVLADLDGGSWVEEIAGERFDVIILADVLEHLVFPGNVLDLIRERRLLSDDGFVVVSFPNASHEAIIAEIVGGWFTYRESGLLDSTHLRFFTLESFTRLAETHGFQIGALHRTVLALEDTEAAGKAGAIPVPVRLEIARANPEAKTYQYVTRLEPFGRRGVVEAAEEKRAMELEAELRASREAIEREREAHERERNVAERSRARVERELVDVKSDLRRETARLERIRGTATWRSRGFLARIGRRVLRRNRPGRS